jgi:hypothetical protein
VQEGEVLQAEELLPDELLLELQHLLRSAYDLLRPAADLLRSGADLLRSVPLVWRSGSRDGSRSAAASRCSGTGSQRLM